MKKIIYLFILGAGFSSCSVESLDSTDVPLLTADAKLKIQESTSTDFSTLEPISAWTYFNGGGHEQGKVEVFNDCNTITIKFTTLGEDLDVQFGLFSQLPALKNGGNFENTVLLYDEEDLDVNNSYTFTFAEVGITSSANNAIVYAKAFGKDAGSGIHGKNNFFLYDVQEVSCEEPVCESGYMIGDKNFNEIGKSNNWGWAHQFNFDGSGSEIREIHHKNGSLGGTVTVSFNNGIVSVEEGDGVSISHLYVSNNEPTETNAPGQFDKEQVFEDEDGIFWVMLKAEVCQ